MCPIAREMGSSMYSLYNGITRDAQFKAAQGGSSGLGYGISVVCRAWWGGASDVGCNSFQVLRLCR